jgi:hypothetical protein
VVLVQVYVRANPWPFYLSWGLSFVMIIALSCSETLRRKYPMNVIFLVRPCHAIHQPNFNWVTLYEVRRGFLRTVIVSFLSGPCISVRWLEQRTMSSHPGCAMRVLVGLVSVLVLV